MFGAFLHVMIIYLSGLYVAFLFVIVNFSNKECLLAKPSELFYLC